MIQATRRPPASYRACRRCGKELNVPRVTTVYCQSCIDVMKLEGNLSKQAKGKLRRRARAEGWDFDNPLVGWPGDEVAVS